MGVKKHRIRNSAEMGQINSIWNDCI